jgi:choline dehydrogenase-like flavoprotein
VSDRLDADVVVVGSGVAGALVAASLAAAGVRVLILEAGPRLDRATLVERYRAALSKDAMAPYPPAPHAPHPMPGEAYITSKGDQPYGTQYIRAVGGTVWHWAACCWRMLPQDFELRSRYGVGRDWPIGYGTLEPYYARAERELGVSGREDAGSPRSTPYPMPPIPLSYMDRRFQETLNANGFTVVTEPVARNSRDYDSRPPCCGNNSCMPICPIGAQYSADIHVAKAEQAGARLIENAVVDRIEVADDGTISGLRYRDPDGGAHHAHGMIYVLAANGIETPKLMLISAGERIPAGIANSSGQVGRNLMDHPNTSATFLAAEPLWPGRGPQEMTSVVNFRDGPFRRNFGAKKLQLANISRNESIARSLLKQRIIGPELDRQIRLRAAHQLRISSFHEQLPHPGNRIVPSTDRRDRLGIPQPEVHYAIDDYVRSSARHTRSVFARIARLMGGTEIAYSDGLGGASHLMGTTIMGADARNAVVDDTCRSYDHRNLFIASSSVFASGGSVNPTLTIAALSLRVADTIRTALAQG